MQRGTHKFQVVAVEDVQRRAVENVQEEVETSYEEVPWGSNVTCSQYFFSVSNSFIYGTPSTSLDHRTFSTVSSVGLTSSQQGFAKRPFDQLNPAEESDARDTNAQRQARPLQKNCSARKRRQFTRARRRVKPTVAKQQHPTSPKHLPRTRTKPHPRPRLLTSVLYCETSNYRQTVVFTRQKLRHTTKTDSQHLLYDNL